MHRNGNMNTYVHRYGHGCVDESTKYVHKYAYIYIYRYFQNWNLGIILIKARTKSGVSHDKIVIFIVVGDVVAVRRNGHP